jgi:hypothetical protein
MRLFPRFLAVGIALLGMTTVAFAQQEVPYDDILPPVNDVAPPVDEIPPPVDEIPPPVDDGGAPASQPASAPEIDPRSATTALGLLAGGLLMVRGRRRAR